MDFLNLFVFVFVFVFVFGHDKKSLFVFVFVFGCFFSIGATLRVIIARFILLKVWAVLFSFKKGFFSLNAPLYWSSGVYYRDSRIVIKQNYNKS